ncbi:MAG TPA: type I pullulanase [Chitinophagaceae bacterium]|nr:type I pullulanase [Chitinophagaceae bacterium]
MRKTLLSSGFILSLLTGRSQVNDLAQYPVYKGSDLGLSYLPVRSSFRIWSPENVSKRAQVILYDREMGGTPVATVEMSRGEGGTWKAVLQGDQQGRFYTYRLLIDGSWKEDIVDPYAKAVGINGTRAMILDLKGTDPHDWSNDKGPVLRNATDAIIYELHVRDASISQSSGIRQKGKFLGLTERGTKNKAGLSTGLDHLKEMGITHVHLLPIFDFNSVDETQPNEKYNWGYDPLNYNVPEGSYATNASGGATRIKELKQLVKTFHQNGLGVIMDVVYNHTALGETSNFNKLVPGYHYRQAADGKFSNATACGNETASERPMMRKFILESMKFWVREYHVDGFRIDLMGVHDIATINSISAELQSIRPGILLYGEGWTAGASPLPNSLRALKKNVGRLDHVAVFSDDIRDGIKGSVFDHDDRGFIGGKPGTAESIKFGVVASCYHQQIDYSKVNYSKEPYARQPYQTVTYAECHDNHVLWDKLAISEKNATEEERKQMDRLALSIVLSSQGIAFLHAGMEFLRSKKGVENSFDSPDSINAIDWDLKTSNLSLVKYVEALIKMRKRHPAFRMRTAAAIAADIRFYEKMPEGTVVYEINGQRVNDDWKRILVCFNGTGEKKEIAMQDGAWRSYIRDNELQEKQVSEKVMILRPHSCSILFTK